MKKFVWLCLAVLLLCTGCTAAPTFETLGNIQGSGEMPQPRQCTLKLPENASVATCQGDTGRIYFCDGYEILVETLSGGNLDATLRALSGFGKEELTLLETRVQDHACYECAWTSAGEGGFQTARTMILDDGVFHYCLTVLAPAEEVSSLQDTWQTLFDSFSLA